MTAAAGTRVCGVVPVDSDCFCGLPANHSAGEPHACLALGCGRTWSSSPLLASDGAA